MKCDNCSAEIALNDRFCGECGTPVAADVSETVEKPEEKKSPISKVQAHRGTNFSEYLTLLFHFVFAIGCGAQSWYQVTSLPIDVAFVFTQEFGLLINSVVAGIISYFVIRFLKSRGFVELERSSVLLALLAVAGAICYVFVFYATSGGFWAHVLFLPPATFFPAMGDIISISIICTLAFKALKSRSSS